MDSNALHIPPNINFECSGCAGCCFEWPVPLTRLDFESVQGSAERLGVSHDGLFRVLNVDDEKMTGFSHSLEKGSDGLCPFLTDEKRCRLHRDFGVDAKPSMCRLFPYTFTKTPSGTYASVSFASTAALTNYGKPLSEQRELLEARHGLFTRLFSKLELDWSSIQLVDGMPLSWSDYLDLETAILSTLEKERAGSSRVDRGLLQGAIVARAEVPRGVNLDDLAQFPGSQKTVDIALLNALLETYNPENAYSSAPCQLDAREIMQQAFSATDGLPIKYRGNTISVGKLASLSLGRLTDETEDLLRRFAYCRIFSKLYFGPGFNFLSLLAGLHHLTVIVALVRLILKLERLCGAELNEENQFERVTEMVRVIERRLTIATYSSEAVAMLEVLLSSPARVERLISLAS